MAPALPNNGTTATAHITGNLTLNSGATTTITILGASASQVIATGTIALGSSTLNLSGLGGSYLTGNLFYTLLSATSIAGTFSTPSSGTFAGYSYSLSYTGTAVNLNLSASTPTNITVAGSPYQVTNVGGSVNPVFQGGTLQVNQGGTYSQAFTLDTSTTNTIDADGNNGTFSGVFSDATTGGNIVFTGTGGGTTTLTGANTYTGTTTITSGALQIGTGGSIESSSAITDNAALIFNSTSATSYANVISGTGTLTQSGTGTTTLTGVNSYTGATTISAGALQIGTGGSIASSSAITNNAALIFNSNSAISYGNNISGTGTLTQSGTGTTTLSGRWNLYSGATIISAGTLSLAGNNTGIPISSVVIDNSTLDISAITGLATTVNNLTGTGNVVLGSQTLVDTNGGTLSGVISGSSGNLTLSSGTLTLSGNNTYTGATKINAGKLALSGSGSIASSSTVTDNSTLDISATTSGTTVNNLTGSGAVVLGSKTLTDIDTNGGTLSGVISGTNGSLIKSGLGTLTLTGVNTYTGATKINAGTLQIGNGGSIESSSAITDNAALIFNSSSDISYGNVISGTGTLTQSGAGTTTLNEINTYTGVTTISSGTLLIDDGGSIASSSAITDNAALKFNSTSDISYGNVISGTGTVTQSGTGTLSLTGANAYIGGTTISSGALSIGNGGTTGSVTGDITDNATLMFNRTDAFTYAGIVSGAGVLNQSGTGTTILTGVNTYTGRTTISDGVLTIGTGGSIASSSGIINNAQLIFNSTSATSYGNVIAGYGSLTQSGTGTTTLTGTNTYTGATTISAGTLALDSGGSLASGSDITINGGATFLVETGASISNHQYNSGTIKFDSTDAINDSGNISGATGNVIQSGTGTTTLSGSNTYAGTTTISGGVLNLGSSLPIGTSNIIFDGGTLQYSAANTVDYSSRFSSINNHPYSIDTNSQSVTFANLPAVNNNGLTKLGSGTLTLSATNTYTGATTVNGGVLAVTGDIHTSPLTVNTGGTISGSGTIGLTTINNGGTIAPALASSNTTATLHVTGNLTLTNNATTSINLLGSSASEIIVNGALTIGGSLNLVAQGGTYQTATAYTLLSATSITGTFNNATTGTFGNNYTYQLSYSATSVTLLLTYINIPGIAPGGTFDASNPSTTTFAGGTLTVDQSDSFSQPYKLNTATTNTINASGNNGTFTGVLSDATAGQPGNINFDDSVGGGTTTLAANNTYTGTTSVNSGTLIVSGSIASSSSLAVNSGGALGGSGYVPSTTINSGGSFLASNSSSAPLHVSGSLTLNPGSNLILAPTRTSYHLGSANTIITANSINGTFGNTLTVFSLYSYQVGYNNNQVTVTYSPYIPPNENSAAGAVDSSVGLYNLFADPLVGQALIDGLNSISAEPYADNQTTGLQFLRRQSDLLLGSPGNNCNAYAASGKNFCAFVLGGKNVASINGQNYLASFNSSVVNTIYGIEWNPSGQWSLGIAYGYGTTNLSNYTLDYVNITGNVNSGSIYGVYAPNSQWKILALFDYSNFSYKGSRLVNISNPEYSPSMASSSFGANGYSLVLKSTYDIALATKVSPALLHIVPVVGIAFNSMNQNGFTETGAGILNLNVSSKTTQSLIATVGATMSLPIPINKNGATITPSLTASYNVDLLAGNANNYSINASYPSFSDAGTIS